MKLLDNSEKLIKISIPQLADWCDNHTKNLTSKKQDLQVTNKQELELKSELNPELKSEKEKRFIKPSLLEVSQFIKEKGYTVDHEQFFNFYESKGWKVGNQPMKDWKAAVSTWQSKNKNKLLEQRVGKQAVNNMDSFKRFHDKMEAKQQEAVGLITQDEVHVNVEP